MDIVSYILLQIIFCFKNRFFDWEKSLGQEKGLSITSNKYGFTSDRVSESDDLASMNASVHKTALGLLAAGRDVMTSTFVRSSGIRKSNNVSSSDASSPNKGHDSKEKERRTRYSTSSQNKTTKMNVLEMILPNKLSSFHSSQIPDDSGHNDIDTSSKGLLGSGSSPSTPRTATPQSAFEKLNILSGFSFDFNSPPSSKYSTIGSDGVYDESESERGISMKSDTSTVSQQRTTAILTSEKSRSPRTEIKLKCASSDSYLASDSTHSIRSKEDV